MLSPLIGFVVGVFISSITGVVVFSIHPKWKITLQNMLFFVAGSFVWVILLSLIYGVLFADDSNKLNYSVAVWGYLSLLIVAVIGGGVLTTYLGRKLFKLK